jgi:hypothetical protein
LDEFFPDDALDEIIGQGNDLGSAGTAETPAEDGGERTGEGLDLAT